MAKTYCTCIGMRSERTARGGRDGCRASIQSYDGSIIIQFAVKEIALKVGCFERMLSMPKVEREVIRACFE